MFPLSGKLLQTVKLLIVLEEHHPVEPLPFSPGKVNYTQNANPTRFDLSSASCVNREVIAFNRNLYKRMKQFEHVKIINSELQREYFTKHRMHMKRAGKEIMAQRIAEHIKENFLKRETPTITLQWKQDIVKRTVLSWKNDTETSMEGIVDNVKENLTLLMGNDNENSYYNSDNSKNLINLDSVTGCRENKGILPKRDRKCLKAKSEYFLWF
jgi:hypothetical protein